ncbi:hypothetical protein QBC40DRAFT_300907 [Triangularia verruculosa]|uniref:Transmembrane protein n=1 Tax=Triangularia verruculosa TaxID=2587418 RepID=A0AAN6XDD0_9PEZI|nr:hypothetical protein QBC40DRAFT_300907 [Triangularia verruculosa]
MMRQELQPDSHAVSKEGQNNGAETIGMAIGDGQTIGTAGNFHNVQAPRGAAEAKRRVPSPLEQYLASRSQVTAAAARAPPAGCTRSDALRSLTHGGDPGSSRSAGLVVPKRPESDGEFVAIKIDELPCVVEVLEDNQEKNVFARMSATVAYELQDLQHGPSIRRPQTSQSGTTSRHTWDLPKATRILWRGTIRQSWARLIVCGVAVLLLFANLFMSIGFVACLSMNKQDPGAGVWAWLWGSLGLFLLVLCGFLFLWWRDGKAASRIEEDEAWIRGKALPPLPNEAQQTKVNLGEGVGVSYALTLSTPAAAVAFGYEETSDGPGSRESKGKGKEVVKSVSRRSLLRSEPSEPRKLLASFGEGTRGLGCRSDTQHSISSEMGAAAPEAYSPCGTPS